MCVHGAHRLGTVRGHQVDGEHLRRRHTRRSDAGSRELRDAREREGGRGEHVEHCWFDGDLLMERGKQRDLRATYLR